MTALWLLLGGLVGLLAGGAIAWLWAGRASARVAADLDHARRSVDQREQEIRQLRSENESAREALHKVELDRGRLEAELAAERRNLDEQRRLLTEAESKLKDVFAGVSQAALKENADTFLTLARQRFETMSKEAEGDLLKRQEAINAVVTPLKAMLETYQQRLAEIEESRTRTYSDIREQLGSVAVTHSELRTQTGQLVSALSRPSVRGRWGELTLQRLLEMAGLSERCDFRQQVSVDGEDGRQQPDLVIDLPGGRTIVVDSKYSADDYLKALECEEDGERMRHLKNFAGAVRRHATQLGQKQYWARFEQSPEYVVMFLPGEALIYAAVQHDNALIEDMLKNRVIVATPTTLIALLKTVAYGWRQAEVEKNIEEVRKLGADIVDRVAVFAGHFEKVGRNLDGATQAYNQAVASLESRLLVSARRMAELGAEASKKVPEIVPPVDTATRKLPESVTAEA